MINGLMLIKATATASPSIVEEAKKIKGVKDAYMVFGRFDVVIFIEAEDFLKLKDLAKKISSLQGIKSTETLPQGD
ncbi:MAG: Lrp/AsnC ligand binding domain-containing protein [archaeon]|nr:Lrp/AsnC ligand binding domain-containing protein [archaeon]MCP8313433.1 Lrp/AsnC ligand binding domain-containing protein [archaeon]MCP8321003.1 Lrp/AsnC ligand binding domain-containing protein [archaeon]